MLRGRKLDVAIRSLRSRPLKQLFFRAMLLKFARDPLGKNRPIRANRFNLNNGARVLYLAESIQTALHEVRAFGFPAHSVTIVPVQVNLNAVVDLRNPSVQSSLHLSPADLSMNFRTVTRAPTQELGERTAAAGTIDGFLYESVAMPGTENLAVFEANLAAIKSTIVVDDPGNELFARLP